MGIVYPEGRDFVVIPYFGVHQISSSIELNERGAMAGADSSLRSDSRPEDFLE